MESEARECNRREQLRVGAGLPHLRADQRGSGDFAGLRKTIQEKAANIEVKIILDEEQTVQKIAQALGPILKELIETIKIKNENQMKELQRGMIQRNGNQ